MLNVSEIHTYTHTNSLLSGWHTAPWGSDQTPSQKVNSKCLNNLSISISHQKSCHNECTIGGFGHFVLENTCKSCLSSLNLILCKKVFICSSNIQNYCLRHLNKQLHVSFKWVIPMEPQGPLFYDMPSS